MSDKPMFLYAGVYSDVEGAEVDYEAVKALYAGHLIGSYDAAIVTKQADGKVNVHKREKPTQHGAWAGLAAGAAFAVVAPVALPALVAAGGAGLGAWIGHLARGMSREDVREIGEMLGAGQAALIVIGIDKDAERVEKAAAKASRYVTKRVEADADAAEQEALATMSAES